MSYLGLRSHRISSLNTGATLTRTLGGHVRISLGEGVSSFAVCLVGHVMRTMTDSIKHVLPWRSIHKVRQAVVSGVSVEVTRLHACGPRSEERPHDNPVDRIVGDHSVLRQGDGAMSSSSTRLWFEDSSPSWATSIVDSGEATDTAEGGCFVQAFELGYRNPGLFHSFQGTRYDGSK